MQNSKKPEYAPKPIIPEHDKIHAFTNLSFVNAESLISEDGSSFYARRPHGFTPWQKEEFIREYREYELFCRIGNREFLASYAKKFHKLLDGYEKDPENVDIFKAILCYVISFHTLQLMYPTLMLHLIMESRTGSALVKDVQSFCNPDTFVPLEKRSVSLKIAEKLFGDFYVEDSELKNRKWELLCILALKDRDNPTIRGLFEKFVESCPRDDRNNWRLIHTYAYSWTDEFLRQRHLRTA